MRHYWFIGIMSFCLWVPCSSAVDQPDERFQIIGLIGQTAQPSHPSNVIVLKDTQLKKTLFLRPGEQVPGSPHLIATVTPQKTIELLDQNRKALSMRYFQAPQSTKIDSLKAQSSDVHNAQLDKTTLNKKPLKEETLKDYYNKYLSEDGFILETHPDDEDELVIRVPEELKKTSSIAVPPESVDQAVIENP